jgi:hypothetical protein
MARFFERMFSGLTVRDSAPVSIDDPDSDLVPVRYRPRLLAQFQQDHDVLRLVVRGLLDACRVRDEDAQIVGLRNVAAAFRRICLVKSVQFYPYLRWGLEHDRMASIQFKAMHAEIQQGVQRVEAMLLEYLDGPWLSERRRRLVGDVSRMARQLAQSLRLEEANVFPLYLPPGQYRNVRDSH